MAYSLYIPPGMVRIDFALKRLVDDKEPGNITAHARLVREARHMQALLASSKSVSIGPEGRRRNPPASYGNSEIERERRIEAELQLLSAAQDRRADDIRQYLVQGRLSALLLLETGEQETIPPQFWRTAAGAATIRSGRATLPQVGGGGKTGIAVVLERDFEKCADPQSKTPLRQEQRGAIVKREADKFLAKHNRKPLRLEIVKLCQHLYGGGALPWNNAYRDYLPATKKRSPGQRASAEKRSDSVEQD